MKKLRLLVPIAVIVVLVLMMMAPATALAAPDTHKGGHHGWHQGCYGGCYQHCTGGFTYVVRCGDTLGDIGWRYGSSALELAQINGICNPNLIYPGQSLWIPYKCW
jgi:nucleoid-associated protein YgaU